jgi:hypothetical protein
VKEIFRDTHVTMLQQEIANVKGRGNEEANALIKQNAALVWDSHEKDRNPIFLKMVSHIYCSLSICKRECQSKTSSRTRAGVFYSKAVVFIIQNETHEIFQL